MNTNVDPNFMIWALSGITVLATVWAALGPLFSWPLKTQVLLDFVLRLVRDGNLERAVKLLKAAPSAPTAQIILAFITDGFDAAEQKREAFVRVASLHRLKLALALIAAVTGLAAGIYLYESGQDATALLVASGVSLLTVVWGTVSIRRIVSDCDLLFTSFFGQLGEAAPPEVKENIRGLMP
ncbi:MAG: hypothetical protein R3E66_20080 [bacterium]